jgi:hypothetical protein
MLIDDDDQITFEHPSERTIYRRYNRLQDKLRQLRQDPTWPATKSEFDRVMEEAEALCATLTNMA